MRSSSKSKGETCGADCPCHSSIGELTMTSFDPKRRDLLKLSAVTGGALAMGELWPQTADAAEAASATPAQVAPAPAPVEVLLRVIGGEHRLALDPRPTLHDALRE